MSVCKFMIIFLICVVSGCSGSSEPSVPVAGDLATDPNFSIETNSDMGFSYFSRKVNVFGIPIYAAPGVDEKRILHAANIMAQYLDNDEDGVVDNELVVQNMLSSGAFLIMWSRGSDLERADPPEGSTGQDLGNHETNPSWHANSMGEPFDASLEEVWHLITHAGYSRAYPEVFGEDKGSLISKAMDRARGGYYLKIPGIYPDIAWYTYYDETCDYRCMVTEYFYWSMTSVLGAQEKRGDDIGDEWRLQTRDLVKGTDPLVFSLLTDPEYRFPKVLPDGTYGR